MLAEGGRIPVANTLPDVDPDEIYAALDADTRPYLKLLVSGAGKGLRGRGDDLREVFRRFEPLHRDLARVTRATARRRVALKRLIHRYGLLMDELGRHPDDLRRLVSASRAVFDALAGEDQNISTSVARLPGALRRHRARAGRGARASRRVLRADARVAARADPQARRDQRRGHAVPARRRRRSCATRSARSCAPRGPFTDDLRLAAARRRARRRPT